MNTQPIEKLDFQMDGSLDVHSIFYTIQGEGPNTGRPAFFLRLAGCNLQCPFCDTEYTSGRKRMHGLDVVDEILGLKDDECPLAKAPLVVVTGGEPFRQNISPVCQLLLGEGFDVQIETNGSLPPVNLDPRVQIIVSPKTGKIHSAIEERATAYKYVIKAGCVDRSDGLPIRALDHTCSPVVAKPSNQYEGVIYIQPMDDGTIRGQRENAAAAVNVCKKYGHTLQVQTHKVLGIE